MSVSDLLRGASASAIAFLLASSTLRAQDALPTIDIENEHSVSDGDGSSSAPGFGVKRKGQPIYRDPPGQTVTTVNHKVFETTPMFTVQEMLQYSPGVTFQQGNFPRDLVISIRGSGNRVNSGVRNIQMYEDGFPIMTADGNANTDMLDPHSFSGMDVYRGPSSAMFGNYAYGGAINFRSFSGAEISGLQTGSEFGSFGYINNYIRAGERVIDKGLGEADVSIFASDARGDGYIAHTAHNLQNGNFLGQWAPTPADRFILKLIYNRSFSEIQNRLSQTIYYLNPFSRNYGCEIATPINSPSLCYNMAQPLNGISGKTGRFSPWQFGTHFDIVREIAGARWEHDFDYSTTWRTQFTYDYLDYAAGTTIPPKLFLGGPVGVSGPAVGISATTDVTSHWALFGMPATHYLGLFYDNLKTTHPSYIQVPNAWHYGLHGADAGKIDSYHSNISLRAREEIALASDLTAAVGFSSNWNRVWGVNTVYNYNPKGFMTAPSAVGADNDYWNTAPEASLTYRYSPEWQLRARYATGYGTPNFTNLTATATGAGNNTSLKAQTNMGVDLGVDWTPHENLTVSVTGFNEWFRNELLQLVSPQLLIYFVNIPSAIHRGVEANVDWRPFEGWRLLAAYTYNDQFFTTFYDQLSSNVTYDRRGNKIPNIPPHSLTARIGYDQPFGDFRGLGAFVEYVFRSAYTIDNANLTSIPGYGLVNVNIHYTHDLPDSYFRNFELFFEVKNMFDRRYVASAAVATDTLIAGSIVQTPAPLLANQGGLIIAGEPRAFIGGVKFRF